VLENPVADLRGLARDREVVLLDYTTGDVADTTSPLSHAALVSRYVEDRWPTEALINPDQSHHSTTAMPCLREGAA
jgi:hypothetical protein